MVVKEYTSSSGAKITICDDFLKSKEEQEEIIKRFTYRIQRYLMNKSLANEETAQAGTVGRTSREVIYHARTITQTGY